MAGIGRRGLVCVVLRATAVGHGGVGTGYSGVVRVCRRPKLWPFGPDACACSPGSAKAVPGRGGRCRGFSLAATARTEMMRMGRREAKRARSGVVEVREIDVGGLGRCAHGNTTAKQGAATTARAGKAARSGEVFQRGACAARAKRAAFGSRESERVESGGWIRAGCMARGRRGTDVRHVATVASTVTIGMTSKRMRCQGHGAWIQHASTQHPGWRQRIRQQRGLS